MPRTPLAVPALIAISLGFSPLLLGTARADRADELKAQADAASDAGRYEKAVEFYRQAAGATTDPSKIAKLRVTAASILHDSLKRPADAKLELREAFAADPEFRIDPDFFPPKFVRFAEEVRQTSKPGKALSPSELRQAADDKLKDGDVTGAIADLVAATDRFPNDPGLWKSLGTAYLKANRAAEAAEAFQKQSELLEKGVTTENIGSTVTEEPKTPQVSAETLIAQGIEARQKLDRVGAIEAFRRATELSPTAAEPYNYLGLAYSDNGQLEEAAGAFRQALQRNDGYLAAHLNLGSAYVQLRRWPEAVAEYRKAVAQDKSDADAFTQLGFALRESGDLKGAAEALRSATQLTPSNEKAWNNLGAALFDSGDVEGAISAYNDALRVKADYPQALQNLALALTKKGDLDGAEKAWQDVLRKEPSNLRALSGLARLKLRKDKLADAVDLAKSALAADPANLEALNTLGLAQKGQGNLKEAIETFEKLTKLAPEKAELQNNLGLVYYESRRYPEAEAAFQKALALKPDLETAKTNLKLTRDVSRAEADSKR